MTASVFANPLFAPLLGDPQVAHLFQAEISLERMVAFERALTVALQDVGAVPKNLAAIALDKIDSFQPDITAIGQATIIDGLPVPELIRQLKAHVGEKAVSAVHTGSTSQDLMDTILVLALRDLSDLLVLRTKSLIKALTLLRNQNKSNDLMGRTRMQAALPISVGDRVDLWVLPLQRHLDRLAEIRPRIEVIQLGGPVGTRTSFQGKGDQIASHMAQQFGLGNPSKSWHAMRDNLVEYAGWLSLLTGTLGKMGQDICLMAQQGVNEISISGGGSSSAMPHKQNPVLAETLVTFARYNAVLIGGMHQASIHEQERSGSAWALEWMCLPQMAETTGRSLDLALKLIGQIESIGSN